MFGEQARLAILQQASPPPVDNEEQLMQQLRQKLGPHADAALLLHHLRLNRGKIHWAVNSYLRAVLSCPLTSREDFDSKPTSQWAAHLLPTAQLVVHPGCSSSTSSHVDDTPEATAGAPSGDTNCKTTDDTSEAAAGVASNATGGGCSHPAAAAAGVAVAGGDAEAAAAGGSGGGSAAADAADGINRRSNSGRAAPLATGRSSDAGGCTVEDTGTSEHAGASSSSISSSGSGCCLTGLPGPMLEQVLLQFDHTGLACLTVACKVLQQACSSEVVWQHAFQQRWGTSVFPMDSNSNPSRSCSSRAPTPAAAVGAAPRLSAGTASLAPTAVAAADSVHPAFPAGQSAAAGTTTTVLAAIDGVPAPAAGVVPMTAADLANAAGSAPVMSAAAAAAPPGPVTTTPASVAATAAAAAAAASVAVTAAAAAAAAAAPATTTTTLSPASAAAAAAMPAPRGVMRAPATAAPRPASAAAAAAMLAPRGVMRAPATAAPQHASAAAAAAMPAPREVMTAAAPPRAAAAALQSSWRQRYRQQLRYEQQRMCPKCGRERLRPLVYGFPSPALLKGVGSGRLVLAGDHLMEDCHVWLCHNGCRGCFRYYPYRDVQLWQQDDVRERHQRQLQRISSHGPTPPGAAPAQDPPEGMVQYTYES